MTNFITFSQTTRCLTCKTEELVMIDIGHCLFEILYKLFTCEVYGLKLTPPKRPYRLTEGSTNADFTMKKGTLDNSFYVLSNAIVTRYIKL